MSARPSRSEVVHKGSEARSRCRFHFTVGAGPGIAISAARRCAYIASKRPPTSAMPRLSDMFAANDGAVAAPTRVAFHAAGARLRGAASDRQGDPACRAGTFLPVKARTPRPQMHSDGEASPPRPRER